MNRTLSVAAAALAAAAFGCAPRGKPAAAAPQTPRSVRIHISEFKFDPAELTVAAGDTIVWVNDDIFLHTSTADGGAWNSEEFNKGGMFILKAPAPGRYEYHCDAHPSMRAVVIVVPR